MPFKDSENQQLLHTLVSHQLIQTQENLKQSAALGRIEGRQIAHDQRITSNTERIARLERKKPDTSFNWSSLLIAILPGIPGLCVVILAALGKLPWSTAATALFGSSGH